ncbi:MAG: DUF6249 domain-containing protein [Marinicellaceae bacterium]
MPSEAIIVGLMILLVAGVIYTFMNNSYKVKIKTHDVLEKSIDKGYELTPEMLKSLSQTKSPKMLDLRRGIILLCIAFATFAFGYIIPNDEGATIFRALSLFPGFVGAGFILVWKLNRY